MTGMLAESDVCPLIIQGLQCIVWFGTIDGSCQYASPSLGTLVGSSPEEIIGTSIYDFIHFEDHVQLYERIAEVENKKTVGMITCRIRHSSGKYLWFDVKVTSVCHESFKAVRIGIIGYDVTQRKRAENRIERAEGTAHVGSWERDVLNNKFYWSAEMYRIFGLRMSPSLSLATWLERVHPDDLPRVHEAIQNANMGVPCDIQYRIIRSSEEIRVVHAIGEVVSEDGIVTNVFGSLQDITERKQVERDLLRYKEDLKLAQRIAQLGHWNWDVQRNDLYWSDEVYRIFGLSLSDRADTTMETFFDFVHHDDLDALKQTLIRALQGEPCDLEFCAVLPDQSNRKVHVISETRFDETGNAVQVFGTVQDVTLQRQTEELLRTSEKLALAGQMAAGIAHEIRNPLTVLKGFIKLMEQSMGGNDEAQYLSILQNEINHIESIVSQLLVFSKPHAAIFRAHDIRNIVEEVVALLGPEALMKNVHLDVECSQEAMMVLSEYNQLKQVFINVAKNAIDAMPDGGELLVKLTTTLNSVLVQFIDEGTGIPADQIARLGEPFYTTKDGGTGLGLMVSKKTIIAHHGSMDISSEVGKGTTVTILLPMSTSVVKSL